MVIKNCKIIYEDRIEEGSVLIKNGKLCSFHQAEENDDTIIDAQGRYLAPGFIDIHIHGAGGCDTMDATFEALNTISKTIATNGTTSFLPTTMTCDAEDIQKAVKTIDEAMKRGTEGATILGTHLEGPFISPDMIGAQNPKYIQAPSKENFQHMVDGKLCAVTSVTLAPEREGALDLIDHLVENQIKVSAGHSAATYDEMMVAINHGLSHTTHLFNAMKGLHHREPGIVGAAFDSDITSEVISDGIHISYPTLRVAINQKGTDKMILVTDAMRACCMPDGNYNLGGQEVYVANGRAQLENGALAGSVLTLNNAVKNIYNNSKLPLHEVVKMATLNPAKYCGVDDHKGLIREGYDADLILFDDEITITHTIVGGKLVYTK